MVFLLPKRKRKQERNIKNTPREEGCVVVPMAAPVNDVLSKIIVSPIKQKIPLKIL